MDQPTCPKKKNFFFLLAVSTFGTAMMVGQKKFCDPRKVKKKKNMFGGYVYLLMRLFL